MKFSDICLITDDVRVLREFYETVFQVKAEGDDIHSVLGLDGTGLIIYAKQAAVDDMRFDFSAFDGTGRLVIGVDVVDVDAQYARLRKLGVSFVTEPRTYPWGARSVHFRDPDGNIIGFRSLP